MMWTHLFSSLRFPLAFFALALVPALTASAQRVTTPTITRIRAVGTNLHLTASIPAGFTSVTLESRGTNELGAWKPRDLRRLNRNKATIVFRVRQSATPQNFRLIASASDKLPAKFYRGKKSFARVRSKASRVPGVFGAETARSGFGDLSLLAGQGNGLPPVRAVVESDVWKISGNRLYYFNQYRGLQILDVSNPDSASLLGTVNFPAAGEQMYLLGNYVVLLARNDCDRAGNSELVVIDVAATTPAIVARVSVRGSIAESRLVGSALYVASQAQNTVAGKIGEWGTLVSSFDLSNPFAPIARETIWLNGYGNVISATENFLFVAVQGGDVGSQSRVNLIDISSPNGTMRLGGAAEVAGRVADKFKINFASGVLTVISEVDSGRGGGAGTILETFSLANILAPINWANLISRTANGSLPRASTAIAFTP